LLVGKLAGGDQFLQLGIHGRAEIAAAGAKDKRQMQNAMEGERRARAVLWEEWGDG